MSKRNLTFIVIPHGDLETRTFTVSYRRLKMALGSAVALLLVFVVLAASWWYVAAQAARVGGLQHQVRQLEAERAKVTELAHTLEQVRAQYERVRKLLGASGTAADDAPALPPLEEQKGKTTTTSMARPGSTADGPPRQFSRIGHRTPAHP